MRNVKVIIKKQLKDTLKNKTVLIQFVLFPLMTLVMENAIRLDGMPELFFTKLFSVMYMGMAPLTATSAIIAEEKEKNTLRVLTMANVKSWEYLLGVGVYVWTLCMGGALVMATGFEKDQIPFYLLVMALGFVLSIVAGACVGVCAKNQMVATSLVMPVMLVLSFAPMLAMFNDTIEKVARFFYTQQVRTLLEGMTWKAVGTEEAVILGVNALLAVMLFFAAFKRKGLE
jgi:ABC-2 type transport system permease protein